MNPSPSTHGQYVCIFFPLHRFLTSSLIQHLILKFFNGGMKADYADDGALLSEYLENSKAKLFDYLNEKLQYMKSRGFTLVLHLPKPP